MSNKNFQAEKHEKPANNFPQVTPQDFAQVWLPLSTVTELLGKTAASIREACIERGGKYRGGVYVFHKIGKRYEITLSSLPESARARYILEHQPTQQPATLPAVQPEVITHDAYESIWETYITKPGSVQEEARRRVKILDEFKALLKSGCKQKDALKIITSRYERVSKPTIWRWQEKTEGHTRQYWEALLAPDYQGRSRSEIPKAAWDFFIQHYLHQGKPDASVIHRLTCQAANEHGWGNLPSCKTFERRIKADIPENALILARQGVTALRQSLPHLKRDYTTLKLHELWESDGRKADIFCRWPDGTICRPMVVIWREVRTRVVLSVRIYTTTNTALIIESLESALYRAQAIPEGMILDNGRDYASKSLTGGQKTRYRFTIKENEPIGALTRLGIAVHWATPYHGAAKPIESFWGKLARSTDCLFPKAYTGRNPVERPEDTHQNHAIPVEQFAARLVQAIHEYHHTVHGGQGMQGKTPLQLYEELSRTHQPRQPTSAQLRSIRPVVKRLKLRDQYCFEFKLEGFGTVTYIPAESMDLRRGREYDVLPDHANPKAPALVYDGEKYLGDAHYQVHTPFLDKDAGRETMRARSSSVKNSKKTLDTVKREALPAIPKSGTGILPELPLPEGIIKQQPAAPEAMPPRYIENSDGITDTHTGEFTPSLKANSKKTEQTVEEIENELAQLEVAHRAKKLAVNGNIDYQERMA